MTAAGSLLQQQVDARLGYRLAVDQGDVLRRGAKRQKQGDEGAGKGHAGSGKLGLHGQGAFKGKAGERASGSGGRSRGQAQRSGGQGSSGALAMIARA